MTDPTAVASDATVPAETAKVNVVSLTPEQLQALINEAVAAGAAQSGALAAAGAVGRPPVPVEVPEIWTVNHLLHQLVSRAAFYNERLERSAHASVDEHFPVSDDVEDK